MSSGNAASDPCQLAAATPDANLREAPFANSIYLRLFMDRVNFEGGGGGPPSYSGETRFRTEWPLSSSWQNASGSACL